MNLEQRLRHAATTLRTKSQPLSELIPMLQEAADALQRDADTLGRLVKANKQLSEALLDRLESSVIVNDRSKTTQETTSQS